MNASTVRDSYPVPQMDEYMDLLGQAVIFSMLDANSGYRQMEIDETGMDITSFVTQNGLFKYNDMPLGLKNAPAILQWASDVINGTLK